MKTALFLWLFAVASVASAAEPLSPELPYRATRTNPVTYEVDFSVVVTPPYKAEVLKVWLPIPQSDFSQEVSEGELASFPIRIEPLLTTEPEYGNKFAYFEFHKPEGAQIVRHRFKIKVWELRWDLDAQKIAAPKVWPNTFDRYRQSDQQSVVVDERFTKLAREIVPRPGNPLTDLTAVMSWVNTNLKYDHIDASLRASSVHALERRMGHCSDYHGFCASLGRAMGFPTRVTYGINTFAKNSPSHCKLEAFLPPYGWVSFDVSETQKMIEAIELDANLDALQKQELISAANNRLASGFRDNTWFCQTRGTDYELVPPAQKRVPVVRTAYIEADGVALEDPDPANKNQRRFAWMTVHEYKADKTVGYPFKDITSLAD
ncbi:MAG TPA: transglutaminase domain-containing protein [Lacipirellulaceae bacterium]|jgi:transglutaminase-like putative cysteine protease|nr:transglutaminase domain-containing protein [Lacipirellulaceae bacterium]